jgi:hypothetical protein
LADTIINAAGKKMRDAGPELFGDEVDDPHFYMFEDNDLSMYVTINTSTLRISPNKFNSDEFKGFINAFIKNKNKPFICALKTPKKKDSKNSGNYIIEKNALIIKYDMESIRRHAVFNKSYNLDKTPSRKMWVDFFSINRTIMIHELTHVYDYFISKGKNLDSYGKKVSGEEELQRYDKNDPQDLKDYLSHNVEVNARFQEVISMPEMKDSTIPFEEYLDMFKVRFDGWNIIPEKAQKRLIKRLYDYYAQLD